MTNKAALLCFPDDQGTGDGKIMKKRVGFALLLVLAVTVIGIIVFEVAFYRPVLRSQGKFYPIPIKEVTGINSKATLKPGCKVINASFVLPYGCQTIRGYSDIEVTPVPKEVEQYLPNIEFTEDDTVNYNLQEGNISRLISNIRIVDVYGDKCTISFVAADNNAMYGRYDYPLDNLDYNEKEVDAANDGIKTDLFGSIYTLDSSPR